MEGRSPGEQPLLPSVRQWLDWKLTSILPKAGGTLDQDPVFMRDLRIIVGVENDFESDEKKLAEAKAKGKQMLEDAIKNGKTGRKV